MSVEYADDRRLARVEFAVQGRISMLQLNFLFSLTPGFSRVVSGWRKGNGFNRFPALAGPHAQRVAWSRTTFNGLFAPICVILTPK